jgi:hypothetical protein
MEVTAAERQLIEMLREQQRKQCVGEKFRLEIEHGDGVWDLLMQAEVYPADRSSRMKQIGGRGTGSTLDQA